MTGRSDLVDVEVHKRQETDRAFGFKSPGNGMMAWIPKAAATFTETGPNGKGTLRLERKLAQEKDLI